MHEGVFIIQDESFASDHRNGVFNISRLPRKRIGNPETPLLWDC